MMIYRGVEKIQVLGEINSELVKYILYVVVVLVGATAFSYMAHKCIAMLNKRFNVI